MSDVQDLVNELDLGEEHEHEWWVFSTALGEGALMCGCNCGGFGVVEDPTKEEWSLAYYAPSNPFRWADNSRVRFVKMVDASADSFS